MNLALITPAWNEQDLIEKTIQSVISQTVKPNKWIVVDDGSTDATADIVKQYAHANEWIELIQLPRHRDRSFAAKVTAFNEGYRALEGIDYDIIGNLDADITFDKDYLAYLLEKFATTPNLGVAGTPFVEEGYSSVNDSYEGENHVPGGCQLFRRSCFEEVGGYVPVRGGGIDWIAVSSARMKGWMTRSYPEKHFVHYRPLGTGGNSKLGAIFDYGVKDYYLGGHPVWEVFRTLYRMTRKPFVIGGFVLMCGYLKGVFTGMQRPVSPELMAFHRKEQMRKLRAILSSHFRLQKIKKFNPAS